MMNITNGRKKVFASIKISTQEDNDMICIDKDVLSTQCVMIKYKVSPYESPFSDEALRSNQPS